MPSLYDNALISSLVVIDIAFFVFIIVLLKKNLAFRREATLEKEIDTFESLVKEADRAAQEFSQQLDAKKRLAEELNMQLDQRIRKLSLLMNRSEAALSRCTSLPAAGDEGDREVSARHNEILKLAAKGLSIEAIASQLAIQRGEVSLVLNMK